MDAADMTSSVRNMDIGAVQDPAMAQQIVKSYIIVQLTDLLVRCGNI